jgi:MFS family permease
MLNQSMSVGQKIYALLCVNAVIMYIDRTNLSSAAPFIQAEMGLNNLSLGAAFSAFSVGYAGFMIFGGRIGDLIGARRGLAMCGVVWAVGTVCTGLIGGLTSLVLARFMVGIGESSVYPICSTVVARWIRPSRRGRAQGALHGFGRLGATLAPTVVTALALSSSWRWAFIVLGAASLVVAVAVWFVLRDDPRLHPGVTNEELTALGHDVEMLDRTQIAPSEPIDWPDFFTRIWPATAVSFSYGWFSWFLVTWVPTYFSHVHGLKIETVAMFSTLVLIFGVIGMVGGGFLTDWWMRRTGSVYRARRDVIILSFVGALLCIVPLLVTADLTLDTIALAVGYFFIELADAAIWMLGTDTLPSHSTTATATVNTGFALSGVVSPIIIGWLLDVTKSWDGVFITSIVVLLIGPFVVPYIRIHKDAVAVPSGGISQLQSVS